MKHKKMICIIETITQLLNILRSENTKLVQEILRHYNSKDVQSATILNWAI